jgi:HlyD family type I secretion membrane fusion protein
MNTKAIKDKLHAIAHTSMDVVRRAIDFDAGNKSDDDAPNIRSASMLGVAISGFFILAFIGWGAVAPIASASIATGVLGVEGKTRIVQHLEGGIVGKINVRDGDEVRAGDMLVRLDNPKARATYELLSNRRLNALALQARLQAEQAGLDTVVYPKTLKASDAPAVLDMIKGQNAQFASRRENLANQISVLEERIAEYHAEIKGLKGRIAADKEQLAFTREQIADLRTLLAEGLARKPRLLELEVKASEIESRLSHSKSQITRNRQRILGAKASISEARTKRGAQVADALSNAESELLDMVERLRAAEDVLARTKILAPVAGVVTNMRVHTTGGVIAPGEPVADIVPANELLIVEARVRPDDIDVVRPGLLAHVRVTALNQRSTAPAPGVVRTVSADRMIDQATGETYFLATVELDKGQVAVPVEMLYPGMSAEVMIETGSRSALAYLFEPLTNSFNRAFREN